MMGVHGFSSRHDLFHGSAHPHASSLRPCLKGHAALHYPLSSRTFALTPSRPCTKARMRKAAGLSPPKALFKGVQGFFKGGAGQKLALKKYEPLVRANPQNSPSDPSGVLNA